MYTSERGGGMGEGHIKMKSDYLHDSATVGPSVAAGMMPDTPKGYYKQIIESNMLLGHTDGGWDSK